MKSSSLLRLLTLAAVTSLIGCSGGVTKSPDVTDAVREALDQANLHDVKVSQDRDKGAIDAPHEVMLRRVAEPSSNRDQKNLPLMRFSSIIYGRQEAQCWDTTDVKYDVKNGVVTLTGEIVFKFVSQA
jgi:hypothetical protein